MPRSLNEIPFMSPIADQVRNILGTAGCKTDNDIVNLGCTGLVYKLAHNSALTISSNALAMAERVRSNMDGSGCGLPCYVPPTLFCRVHNTIGGLQVGQVQHNPEGVPLCSRELNAEESLHVKAVQAGINQEGVKEAKARFGLEEVEVQEGVMVEPPKLPVDPPTDRDFVRQFLCPEHKEVNWKCRYCLAAAIINGPLEPKVDICSHDEGGVEWTAYSPDVLSATLRSAPSGVQLHVIVARWSRELKRQF